MSDELDRDLHQWFALGDDEVPPEPFSQLLLARVQRRERALRWQRQAALLAAGLAVLLLMPQVAAVLGLLAELPLLVVALGGEWWMLVVLAMLGGVGALARVGRVGLR